MRQQVVPKQADRLTQSLGQAIEAQQRQRRANGSRHDGVSLTVTIAANASAKVRHGLGRVPAGVQVDGLFSETALLRPIRERGAKYRTRNYVELFNDNGSAVTLELWVF